MNPQPDARWLEEAVEWIRGETRAAGLGAATSIEPHRITQRAVVLRVRTPTGRLFFKGGLARARHETALTTLLSARYPAHMPEVLAADVTAGRLLMREVRGPSLVSTLDLGCWARAFETLGRIQCELSACVDDLFEAGCRDRSAPWVSGHVEALAAHACADEDIPVDVRRRIAAAVPTWKTLCAEPTAGIPDTTLDHGDLHPGNVVSTRSGSVYLDWESGAIGHPFWSALILLGYMDRLVPAMAGQRHALERAYLRPWAALASPVALARAFDDVRPVASLRYAIGLLQLLPEQREQDAINVRTTIATCVRAALAIRPL